MFNEINVEYLLPPLWIEIIHEKKGLALSQYRTIVNHVKKMSLRLVKALIFKDIP